MRKPIDIKARMDENSFARFQRYADMSCLRVSAMLVALCEIGLGVCVAQQKTLTTLPNVTIAPPSSATVNANVIRLLLWQLSWRGWTLRRASRALHRRGDGRIRADNSRYGWDVGDDHTV
jgi:hypothetical protein